MDEWQGARIKIGASRSDGGFDDLEAQVDCTEPAELGDRYHMREPDFLT